MLEAKRLADEGKLSITDICAKVVISRASYYSVNWLVWHRMKVSALQPRLKSAGHNRLSFFVNEGCCQRLINNFS